MEVDGGWWKWVCKGESCGLWRRLVADLVGSGGCGSWILVVAVVVTHGRGHVRGCGRGRGPRLSLPIV